jgi:hypothetical protein
MKKLILLFVVCMFAGNVFAQPAKGMPALDKTGGWVFNDWGNSNNIIYNPLGPGDKNFPKITFFGATGSLVPDAALKEKLTQLRDIFKEAYPNPQGHSILYQLSAAKEKLPGNPRFISMAMFAKGIENDGKGGLTQMNIASTQGDRKFGGDEPNYDGLISVFINKIPADNGFDFFPKQTRFDEVLKTKQIPNLSGVYLRPPLNNFAEAGKYRREKDLPLPTDKAVYTADNCVVFRHMEYFDSRDYGLVERHMDKIILTNYKKLPFSSLTRKDFLMLLLIYKKQEIDKLKSYFEGEKAKRTLEKSEIDRFNQTLEDDNAQIEIINKLTEINQNSLQKPAILSVEHKNIINDLSSYTIDKNNRRELKLGVLKDVFIDDYKIGYTPSRFTKYYKSDKDEDFQSIMVNWYYEIPVANNPKYKNHPSLDNRSLYMAMKTKFDWAKLASLLTKPNKVEN